MFLRYLLLLLSIVLLASCAQPPVDTIRQARTSGREAFAAKAKTYVPRAYREYEYAMQRAQRFQMEEDIRWIPAFRNYTRVLDAYGLAIRRGREARELSLNRQAEVAEETQRKIASADSELADLRETVTGVPVGRPSGGAIGEADILILEAQRLAELGEFEKAKRAADRAMEKVRLVENRAGHVLDRLNQPNLIEKWRRWVRDTVEWSSENAAYAVVVDKSRHTCTVYYRGAVRKSYSINLGVNGFNQKYRAGDNATPEGRYRVVRKQDLTESRYHKGLLLNYPNDEDWQRFQQAKQERFIPTAANIGGLIMLHGDGRKNQDWTQGCVALTNKDMDEIYGWAEVGMPVTIVGRDTTRSGSMAAKQPDIVAKTREKIKRNGKAGGF